MLTNNHYNDLIVYSALVSDCEKPDFKNDALAGVRANYFNSDNSAQSDKTDIQIDGRYYNLSYLLKSGEPLSWKITRNNMPFQTVVKSTGGTYAVITYGENGIIYKRQYFNSDHIWTRTEYYDKDLENVIVAIIKPEVVSDYFSIKLETIGKAGKKVTSYLFPSKECSNKKCSGLVYSNYGMLWFDESFKPENIPAEELNKTQKHIGFDFKRENFNSESNVILPYDLEGAEYLEKTESGAVQQKADDAPQETSYSAYDKIEKILFEAHKTNKHIFGEILNQIPSEPSEENVGEELTEEREISADNPIQHETAVSDVTDNSEKEISAELTLPQQQTASEFEDTNEPKFTQGDHKQPESVIETDMGEYSYYGELDFDGKRTGVGRTVTPDGITSYEGGYTDDKRQGFGVCYYKSGSVNYVGNWDNGKRTGCGVGFRQSDGTLHAGKWSDNMPEGIGARFDRDGGFIDVCTYIGGIKNGKSVSFDENGSVVIEYWRDGRKISEKVITDGE